jgi:GntR family transcriptional regulator
MADLSKKIGDQRLHAGAFLPSEAALATDYGVSRMTVRQALAGLAEQGMLERRHGRGTMVARRKLRREAQRPIGLAEEIESRGQIPGSHVLRLEEISPAAVVRHALWIGPRAKAVLLRRLRFADSVLIGLQDSYIPASFAPGLARVNMEDRSLTRALLERHGLVAAYAELTIESIEASPEIASALDVPRGTALLKSTRLSYLQEGRPLEQTTGWFLGTRYSYQLVQGVAPPLAAEGYDS